MPNRVFRPSVVSVCLRCCQYLMSLSTYKLDGRSSSFREKRTYFGLGCHNRKGVSRSFMGVKGIHTYLTNSIALLTGVRACILLVFVHKIRQHFMLGMPGTRGIFGQYYVAPTDFCNFTTMLCFTHGLRMSNEGFFHWNAELLGLGRPIGQMNSGAFGVFFGQTITTHFGTVSPLSMFSIIQPLFLQETKPLYPHSKYLFGIGIWIWAANN